MNIKFTADLNNPPIGGLVLLRHICNEHPVEITWANETSCLLPGRDLVKCYNNNDVMRTLAKQYPDYQLYGKTFQERTEIDAWMCLALTYDDENWESTSQYLSGFIENCTYLVGNDLSMGDLAIFTAIHSNLNENAPNVSHHIQRWYNLVKAHHLVSKVLKSLPSNVKFPKCIPKNSQTALEKGEVEKITERRREGKFVDLPGAEMGKVVVRFPPEASGYLHIGHAKAALLNQYYAQTFNGKFIMRFDDTNPAKETVEFENVILGDLEKLQIKPDVFTHTSNYFDIMLNYCEKLIKTGRAYVDDTVPEQMKMEREQKIESKNRSNDIEKNMSMWKEMINGTAFGQKCCVRAKIDMSSLNGCMRDPTIYRCKNEPHPRTGTKYKVYPTYDFACPIVDAIENVTHTLRTMEYHDRDDQFYWFIDALNLRKPYIWEYSRLNMTNTVLSKRKLTWFVDEGLVDGWDDPRFPTVRGVIRRGMTVDGLREFIIAQGSSKSVVFMNWDKIWSFNKKVIDPIAPRYTALEFTNRVVVNVNGIKTEKREVHIHPKNENIGKKVITISSRVYIDYADAECLKDGENATFINWGNICIEKIHKDASGRITSVEATPNLDNKDYKKTLKLTWLGVEDKEEEYTPTYCVYFDNIISKAVLGKDEDFKQYIGHKTREELRMLGEPALKECQKGDIIQLQRRGFFKVDSAYGARSLYTNIVSPLVLFAIPDGHTKDVVTSGLKINTKPKAVEKSTDPVIAEKLSVEITKQGDKIRDMKATKAHKAEIACEVQKLLAFKADYKNCTGCEWKSQEAKATSSSDEVIFVSEDKTRVNKVKEGKAANANDGGTVQPWLAVKCEISPDVPTNAVVMDSVNKIIQQGDKVREMKASKCSKEAINIEIQLLLALKSDYKSLTGKEYIAGEKVKTVDAHSTAGEPIKIDLTNADDDVDDILAAIKSQGMKVRMLKGDKAPKEAIDIEVRTLLSLKSKYKSITGQNWTPDAKCEEKSATAPVSMPTGCEELTKEINVQGSKVREMKASGVCAKDEIDREVKALLQLKAKYKEVTGTDFRVPNTGCSSNTKSKSNEKKRQPKPERETPQSEPTKKQTRLGLEATKEDNLPEWYSQVITKGELIEYYDVSGCYILRHWSFAIWKFIKNWFDVEITKMGVKECYFPIFVSQAVLEKEKTHIADFAPEVAWVTKSGESDLAEPIAVRPTSETAMYPAYAKWIQSYRDLPIRLNQWNNVVRWEFKHPQPFLRTREFLWQEGHTAFATKPEADKEVLEILDLYAHVYTNLLAIPVIKGRKTEKEKFAGGDYTTTVEAFITASGRAIQGATSHHLGQNFSRMFEIIYEDPQTQEKRYVYQNSWGITTRTIGVMIMIHADNQGLVLPPHVACIQAIIVPCGITVSMKDAERQQLIDACQQLERSLVAAGVRCEGDYRDNYSPGWKFNHWELKGVPVRIEVGPKDLRASQIVAVRRDSGEKLILALDNVESKLKQLLETVHDSMLAKASTDLTSHTKTTKNWSDFCQFLDHKNILLSPFCGETPCEDKIKEDSARDADVDSAAPSMGAKSLCIPFNQPATITSTDKCIHPSCTNAPKYYTLFGRSY